MVFYFYYYLVFFSLFPGGINISLTYLELSAGKGFDFTILSAIFVSYKFICCFSCFMDYFLTAVFRVSSPALIAVSNICFPYLLDRFLANDQIPCFLTYFLVFGSVK